ncbi:CapA family protein [Paraburkholderia sp. HD33-4]|uniref:CapA family protein n=1 Tax=Paraburkholderia sp. HD33-4 TaxID=2883242 RepID=UPI001F23E7FC|nr:CapA family protein [Paraburkholderia sp. HD33-4]
MSSFWNFVARGMHGTRLTVVEEGSHGTPAQAGTLTVALTGQSMIRGDTRLDAPEAASVIRSLIKGDVAFTNFEAAVYDPKKGGTARDGRFASPPGAMEALKSFGFNLLSLANNHSFDVKAPGIVNTLETAEGLEMAHAGIGRDLAAANKAIHIETPKGKVAFISFASGQIGAARATESQPGVSELRITEATPNAEDMQRILQSVREAKESADIVIVSHHNHYYPDVERPADFMQFLLSELPGRLAPAPWLEPWARQLVDAGADVVAMHGPPFLHGMEVYRGKPIFYSLGNFIFQVPPESVHLEEPIMWESLVAYVDFEGSTLKAIRFQPVAMNKIGRGLPNPHDQFDVNEYHRTRGLPRPAKGNQARFLLERFAQFSKVFGTELVIRDDGTAELKLDVPVM